MTALKQNTYVHVLDMHVHVAVYLVVIVDSLSRPPDGSNYIMNVSV